MFNTPITRRKALSGLLKITGGIALTCGLPWPLTADPLFAETKPKKWIVEGAGNQPGYSIKMLIRKMFDSVGGIKHFISKGDVVAIKPNISWAQPPDLAATTNPEVLKAVIELCQDAGAKTVRIADHTINDARRCFAITGAGQVAEKTGAELIYPRSSLMKDMRLRGERIDVWPVFTPIVEADKLINLPIAKVHGLSGLTLGMKNWIGAVGGRRPALHQDIHQTIADLAGFFKPTLTLIDATRILVANGPSGGNESDVKTTNLLFLSNDQVAADTKAAMLFGKSADDLGFIKLAAKRGIGTSDLAKLTHYQVSL